MFKLIKDAINAYNKYLTKRANVNYTIKELSSLSDKELNDIGIHRSMIRTIAEQTAEENKNLKGWV